MKVDCQAGVGMMGSRCGGGPLLAASFHAALEESIARHFPGNHCINCMAHSTENIYRHEALMTDPQFASMCADARVHCTSHGPRARRCRL